MRWYGRLGRSGEIAFVRRRGRRLRFASFDAIHAVGREATLRVAFSVSKSVGAAVVRNRVRRRIQGLLDRSAVRPRNVRLVFVAHAAACDPEALARDVDLVLRRLVAP